MRCGSESKRDSESRRVLCVRGTRERKRKNDTNGKERNRVVPVCSGRASRRGRRSAAPVKHILGFMPSIHCERYYSERKKEDNDDDVDDVEEATVESDDDDDKVEEERQTKTTKIALLIEQSCCRENGTWYKSEDSLSGERRGCDRQLSRRHDPTFNWASLRCDLRATHDAGGGTRTSSSCRSYSCRLSRTDTFQRP